MGDETGATPYEKQNDEAWAEFRRQLADHCATLVDDDHVFIEIEQAPDVEDLPGAAPYLQLVGWGEGAIRAEVCSNAFLDDRFLLAKPQERQLAEMGWNAPTYGRDGEPDSGSPLWWADVELRDADRLAVMCVGALRDVYGCAHPAFLVVDGFEPTGFAAPEPGEDDEPESPPEPALAYAHDRDELRAMVDRAVGRVYGEPVTHDSDGDVAIVLGESVLFVIVSDEEPILELFAELVHGVEDLEAAEREVAVLNRDLMFGTCLVRDDRVLLRHRLCGAPFVPAQFRMVLSRVSADLDRIAGDLATRVGGRRFLDLAGVPEANDDGPEPLPESLAVLRELLAAGPVDARTVAALFDGELIEITEQIEALRHDPPADLDVAEVLAALRGALQFLAVRKSHEMWDRPRRPALPRRSSHQPSLLSPQDVGEQALDLGAES
jgi:hypothetical protein